MLYVHGVMAWFSGGGIMFERINMLIVDDVALNRTPLAALFSEEYDILEAGSGQEALDQLGKHQVGVVLLDVRMPGMDGMEVLRRIKANPATAHIPVIMNTIRGTSTSGDSTVEAEALELGASDFITKPYIPAVVWRRVHNALARTTLNRLELQQELQEVQGRLTSLSSSIPGGVGIFRVENGMLSVIYANDVLAGYYGYDKQGLENKKEPVAIDDTVYAADRRIARSALSRVARRGYVDTSLRIVRSDGKPLWVRLCATLFKKDGDASIYHCVMLDISKSKSTEKALKDALRDVHYALRHDSLTNIYNFETFADVTAHMLREDPDGGYLMVRWNIERFKMVNELYGTAMGDKVLMAIGRELDRTLRGKGTYGRLGSDTFIACFKKADFDPETLLSSVEELLMDERGLNSRLTLAVGVYPVTNPDLPVEVMSDRANMALKTVIHNYLRHCGYYDAQLRDSRIQEQSIIDDMESALANGEFHIYYQPICDLTTGRLVCAEALARWHHPERGIIAPDKFIPLFEHSGFIIKLDHYVWEGVARDMRRWQDSGHDPLPISINVSRMDFYDAHLVDHLVDLVERYDIDRKLLRIEVTESAYMDNPSALLAAISSLKECGFTLLMDDFGSGYSSFNALKDIPVDVIKVDLGFMGDFEKSRRAGNIVASIINMARWLDMRVVAEGVETKAQCGFLRGTGCDYGQGFLFSRPVPGEDFWNVDRMRQLNADTAKLVLPEG